MKIRYIIIIFILFLFLTFNVNAASASLSVSSSKIEEGKSVTATVSMNGAAAWNITINSSGATSGCTKKFADASSDGNNVNKTFSVTCKSTSTGIINFVMSGDITSSDGSNVKISGSKSVTVTEPRKLSTNNKLKDLSVEGYEISPKFDSDVNEYSVNVPSTVEKIKISAKKADSYASLDGTGEFTVEEGVNSFEIVVTSETGVSNVYKLNVSVEDQNPIIVKVDGREYSVVKIAKNLVKPELFDETTIKIGEYDIPAFKNDACKYTLVGLKNSNGNIELFIYEDGEYTKYNDFQTASLSIIFLEMKNIPTNYVKTNITVNETKMVAYKVSGDNRVLLYGLNIETGEKNYYSYDKNEKTLQIFDLEKYEESVKSNQFNMYIIIGLSVAILLLLILVILFASKANKLKKLCGLKGKKDFNF